VARQLHEGILPVRNGWPGERDRLTRRDVTAARTLTDTGSAPTATETATQTVSGRQLAAAYGALRAQQARLDGRGVTVVLPIWYGVPEATLHHDLAKFSKANHLPAADVQVRATGPIAPMPAPDAEDAPTRYVIAEEITLDASMIHAMAPKAKIVVLATPGTDPTDGGYKEILDATRAYARTHPGVIVSMSYGTYETGGGLDAATLGRLDAQLGDITRRYGATFVVANGDTGYTDGLTPTPNVPWPASSPHVTAVAGTQVHLDAAGRRISPDTVWSDTHNVGLATGGGLSAVFTRPRYQNPYAAQVRGHRADSDLAANGSIDSRVEIYSTFNVLGGTIDRDGGWRAAAGTSQAAPLIAGIVALARQAAGRPLGQINPALYALAAGPAGRKTAGIADVTDGCNTVPGNDGFCAAPGWDPVSGNGTITDAARLAAGLAFASRTDR
jgi:kumamolisin